MGQTKKEILDLFTESIKDASEEYKDGEWLSEAGEVRVIFYGHYPEYSDDFDLIQKRLNSFFDFSDEELLDIG